jgi:hypothetical protein
MNNDAIRERAAPALQEAMEPSEKIIAGAAADRGTSPVVVALCVVGAGLFPLIALLTNSGLTSHKYWWLHLVDGLVFPLAAYFLQRPVFIAVTNRQFICYRLARLGHRPVRMGFAAPLTAVRISSYRRVLKWRSFRYSSPGAPSLRFHLNRSWRKDLDAMMTALQAAGASVEAGPGYRQLPAPESPQKAAWLTHTPGLDRPVLQVGAP